MLGVYTTATIRAAEERALADTAPGELMQRAATGLAVRVAQILRQKFGRVYGSSVLLVVGTGNNGGDGLYAGVWLAKRGAKVSYWPVAGVCHKEGEAALCAAGGYRIDQAQVWAELTQTEVIVDAVLGIGGRGGLREPVASLAKKVQGKTVIAVDLPSGLNADQTRVDREVFSATHTVTFGGLKLAQVATPARDKCGEITVIDIGLDLIPDYQQWEVSDLRQTWPTPKSTDDKYHRGVVGLDVGSKQYPGAAILAASGSTYSGVGMVRTLTEVASQVVAVYPNVVVGAGRINAQVAGCGWGEVNTHQRLETALARRVPTVFDADALNALAEVGPDLLENNRHLLTPHSGELARLLGISRTQVENDPVTQVRKAAGRYRNTVLLKGATQYLATPDGGVTLAIPGPAWNAQAGSGDVLAGVAGSLMASGLEPKLAGLAAASLQALAASRKPGPYPPQEFAGLFPNVIAELIRSSGGPH